MKGIKKALSVIICTAIIFATFPVAVYAASTLQDGDFVFTVEGGKATIVHYSGQTESEVTIPVSLNGYPVTAIGDGAFASCGILSQITVPDGVLSIGNSAFAACENLKYAHLADSITYIGEGAFYGCNSLGNINIPKSLTVISSESFSSCYSISSITLPNKIEIIGSGAFKSCYNLSEVSIPKSVTVIGANAFSENYSLNKIYYCGTQDEWNRIEINSNNSSLTEKQILFHKYETSYVAPTCVKLGHTLYKCLVCADSYTVEDASSSFASHDYEDEFTVDKNPTEFEEGIKSRHCKNCTAVTDVTAIPITALASGKYGADIEWIIKTNGTLVISGSGAIDDYKLPVFTPWYNYSELVTALEVTNGITKLGNNSFSSLEKLTYVTVNGTDTEFGYYVFPLNPELTVKCYSDSKADLYAQKFGHITSYFGAPQIPVIESIEGNTVTLKKLSGYEYSINRYEWQKSNIFTIEKNEIVTFYQRKAATGSSSASPSSDAAKGISVSAPQVILTGYDIICIKPMPDFEYGLEGVLWQEDNKFTKWIIPNETYTVYQRYNGTDDVFAVYDTNGTKITVNGNNKSVGKNAEYLMWLKKHLFETDKSHNYGADINNDFCIDILDLIALKNELLEVE